MRSGDAATAGALEMLRSVLAAEDAVPAGGAVAAAAEPLGNLAAAGPRAGADPGAYAFVVESVLEGYLLHYGRPRLAEMDDPDLRLLAGDLAYALGLARLAEVGDLEAVAELADLISLCAQVHADGRAGDDPDADSLPAALWALAALALAGGPWAGHAGVKEAVRAGDPDVRDRALGEALARAGETGLGDELMGALIAFKQMFHAASRST
jgi:hypothetical protein